MQVSWIDSDSERHSLIDSDHQHSGGKWCKEQTVVITFKTFTPWHCTHTCNGCESQSGNWILNSPAKNTGVVAIPFSRGSSWPRDWTCVSCFTGRFFKICATREAPNGPGVDMWPKLDQSESFPGIFQIRAEGEAHFSFQTISFKFISSEQPIAMCPKLQGEADLRECNQHAERSRCKVLDKSLDVFSFPRTVINPGHSTPALPSDKLPSSHHQFESL